MSIKAMKQALEALEAVRWSRHLEDARTIAKNARYSLRQAIEQAEQWDTSDMAHRPGGLSVEQEPVAWIHRIIKDGELLATHVTQKPPEQYEKWWTSYPLYTAPPKREWVGLTSEELAQLTIDNAGYPTRLTAAIEAKLKEKNCG